MAIGQAITTKHYAEIDEKSIKRRKMDNVFWGLNINRALTLSDKYATVHNHQKKA